MVITSDHFIPASNLRHAEILKSTREWAQCHGVAHFFEYEGILHNLLLERRLARPGLFIAGADSHTTTAGAVGAVAVPVGSTELATVLATGQMWVRVPRSIRVVLEGRFQPGVAVRDAALALLAQLGLDYANYAAIEFSGPGVRWLGIDERAVLTNTAVEMGAKNAIVPPDDMTWLHVGTASDPSLTSDTDAEYVATHRLSLDRVEPQVALPHRMDNVQPISAVAGTPVDVAYIGSCIGGRLADLRMAAQVLKGRRVKIPLLVVPATRGVYEASLRDGTLATLSEAGAIVQAPGCGACAGVHMGVLASGERLIATVTRNFRGRMGSPEAEIFLGSAWTVAASAIEGAIADPRPHLN